MTKLPDSIKLGVATSGAQIEGGDKNSSWFAWCEKGKIKDGSSIFRADDHYLRYEEDIDRMAQMGVAVYRFGVEWSRIEPNEGEFSKTAIAHYRRMVEYMLEKNIRPLLTLHHFTIPLWLEESGGFERAQCVDYFARYVRFVVENLGDLISEYITINEPNVYATMGYFFGEWPPGKKDLGLTLAVMRNMVKCHVAAYKVIHGVRAQLGFALETKVGVAHHLRVFAPATKKLSDKLASWAMRRAFQGALMRSISYGKLSLPLGLSLPVIKKRRYYEFIGVNYYTRSAVKFKGFQNATFEGTQVNDLGWEIYPQGLYEVCAQSYKKFKAPVWITENGTCDNNDTFRAQYIKNHLEEIARLAGDGVRVERYYHWSFMDNFEWIEGESARFGLVHVDFETQRRTTKSSGEYYQKVCNTRQLD